MKITKKSFSLTVKASANYNTFGLSEGFEIEMDSEFNDFDFEAMRQALKDRLIAEAKDGVKTLNEELNRTHKEAPTTEEPELTLTEDDLNE